jgi:hypothetical protein
MHQAQVRSIFERFRDKIPHLIEIRDENVGITPLMVGVTLLNNCLRRDGRLPILIAHELPPWQRQRVLRPLPAACRG